MYDTDVRFTQRIEHKRMEKWWQYSLMGVYLLLYRFILGKIKIVHKF